MEAAKIERCVWFPEETDSDKPGKQGKYLQTVNGGKREKNTTCSLQVEAKVCLKLCFWKTVFFYFVKIKKLFRNYLTKYF